MGKNGTLQDMALSHIESATMAADATDRATAFLETTTGIRGASGNAPKHSMATTRRQEIGAGAANAWARTESISRIRRPYDDVRGTLLNPLRDPLTLETTSKPHLIYPQPTHRDMDLVATEDDSIQLEDCPTKHNHRSACSRTLENSMLVTGEGQFSMSSHISWTPKAGASMGLPFFPGGRCTSRGRAS